MKYSTFVVLLLLFFNIVSCYSKTINIKTPNGDVITLELADTPQEREKGLMYRKSLKQDHGMLFVFPDVKVRNFWMKNTSIPLSIAYLDRSGVVVRILDMFPYSLEPINSKYPAKYAIEMNRGVFDDYGIEIGTAITISSKISKMAR